MQCPELSLAAGPGPGADTPWNLKNGTSESLTGGGSGQPPSPLAAVDSEVRMGQAAWALPFKLTGPLLLLLRGKHR